VRSTRQAIALAICLTLPELAAGQGLGAAAAKEKQRRASGEKGARPAKTYTEESLKELPPVEGPGSSSGSRASSSAPSGSTAETANDSTVPAGEREEPSGGASQQTSEERDRAQAEAEWRARVAAARSRVERARARASYYESLVITPGVTYVDESGATVIGSLQQLQGLTRRAKAELAEAEKALEDLLEEARRAGAQPGWLR
jgi:hypothetical protein